MCREFRKNTHETGERVFERERHTGCFQAWKVELIFMAGLLAIKDNETQGHYSVWPGLSRASPSSFSPCVRERGDVTHLLSVWLDALEVLVKSVPGTSAFNEDQFGLNMMKHAEFSRIKKHLWEGIGMDEFCGGLPRAFCWGATATVIIHPDLSAFNSCHMESLQ